MRALRTASSFRHPPVRAVETRNSERAESTLRNVIRGTLSGLLGAAALGLLAAPTAGQQISSPYEFVETSQGIRVFGGYVFTDRGAVDIGPGSAPAGGVGYTIRISGPFNIDAQASFMPTTRRVYDVTDDTAGVSQDPMVGLVQLGTADLSLLMLDASLRFDITGPRTWYALQPYALIGAGGVFVVSTDNAVEEELPAESDARARFQNGFTGHIGAGVEWHATERFTLRADARDVLWKVHVPDGFQPGRRNIDDDPWVQNLHLSLGLVYRF